MSLLFGPIVQNGYVVRDLDAAMGFWSGTLRVGPFFVTRRVRFRAVSYRGAPSAIEMAVAVAYSGTLQIELIQPLSDAPSIYRDHLSQHGAGLQHVGVLADDYDARLAKAEAAGFVQCQSGQVESGLRFAYLDRPETPAGCMVELIEQTPGMMRWFDKVRQAAADWAGDNPIRS